MISERTEEWISPTVHPDCIALLLFEEVVVPLGGSLKIFQLLTWCEWT